MICKHFTLVAAQVLVEVLDGIQVIMQTVDQQPQNWGMKCLIRRKAQE